VGCILKHAVLHSTILIQDYAMVDTLLQKVFYIISHLTKNGRTLLGANFFILDEESLHGMAILSYLKENSKGGMT
jgi:hypothetical protein